MTKMLFDTQKVVDRLMESGVPAAQARAHASVLADVISSVDGHVIEHFATQDSVVRAIDRFDAKIEKLRSDLMRWVLTVVVAAGFIQTALIVGLLLKLLP
ncbi:MAG: hypothetical protein ACXWC4_19385 [Telluria sp.]